MTRQELEQAVIRLLPAFSEEELTDIIQRKASLKLADKQTTIEKRKEKFMNECGAYVPTYGVNMVRAFFDYWTEPNKSQTKMRFEMEKTWELSRRLARWANNQKFPTSVNSGQSKLEQLKNAFR